MLLHRAALHNSFITITLFFLNNDFFIIKILMNSSSNFIIVAPIPVATATATATASVVDASSSVADEMNVSSEDTVGKQ